MVKKLTKDLEKAMEKKDWCEVNKCAQAYRYAIAPDP